MIALGECRGHHLVMGAEEAGGSGGEGGYGREGIYN